MRRGMKPGFVVDEQQVFMGACLSSDHCAEHEWGISKMKDAFGVDPEAAPGIARRKVSQAVTEYYAFGKGYVEAPTVKLYKDSKYVLLLGNARYPVESIDQRLEQGQTLSQIIDDDNPMRELTPGFQDDWEMSAAWDEGEWGILAPAKYTAYVEELYKHFQECNILIMMTGGGVFQNAGLTFAIADRFPEELANEWKEADESMMRLEARHQELGIEDLLKATRQEGLNGYSDKIGCYWHALSPRWKDDSEIETNYDIVYWLNPYDQQNNYFGWVTIEDLELWAQGRGKIPGGADNYGDNERRDARVIALRENEEACVAWMRDRLLSDGCPKEEADKYNINIFIRDFYENDWKTFVEDATAIAEAERG